MFFNLSDGVDMDFFGFVLLDVFMDFKIKVKLVEDVVFCKGRFGE